MIRRATALAAVASLGVVASAQAQAPVDPDEDPFYAAPPKAELAAAKPGTVLDSRETTLSGLGLPLPNQAWQLLYRTTDAKGKPEAAVTTVILPVAPMQAGGKLPLVSYQTAEDSLGTQCAPSYTFRTGDDKEIVPVQAALARGWAAVVPDYEGPESQYGAGRQAGHAVIDSIRAARRFKPADLGRKKTQIGIWGYSGGGLASAWATELAPRYAPRLHIAGVAAGGVPPDIEAVARQIDGGPFGGILFAAAQGIERAYPEMNVVGILNEQGKALYEKISDECINDITSDGAFKSTKDLTTVDDALSLPRIQRVLRKNHLGKHVPDAPIYEYHAINDELIPIKEVDEHVAEYCDEGVTISYYRDPASEHVSLAVSGAPAALLYLADRFAGEPAPSTC